MDSWDDCFCFFCNVDKEIQMIGCAQCICKKMAVLKIHCLKYLKEHCTFSNVLPYRSVKQSQLWSMFSGK